jgi:ankyrin repeat protein
MERRCCVPNYHECFCNKNGSMTRLMDLCNKNSICNEDLSRYTDEIKSLLDNGEDVNFKNKFGKSALMYSLGNEQNFKLLVEYGADLNVVDNDGNNLLILACRSYYNNNIINMLISKLNLDIIMVILH